MLQTRPRATADLQSSRLLLCGFVSFTGLLVAFAEQGVIPLAVLPFAAVSVLLIDGPDRRGISTILAAVLGIAAFGFAGAEFLGESEEARLLAGVHLLTYLTCVLLLLRKGPAELGRLLLLGVLQISLAALLTNNVWLGAGLMAGLFLSVWSLVTLQWLAMTTRSESSLAADRSAVGRLLGPSSHVAALALVGGSLLFAVVPRIWTGQLNIFNNASLPGTTAETGYSEEVQLGDVGSVMENEEVVLRIRSTDTGGEVVNFEEVAAAAGESPPLLRGGVMGRYDRGRWIQAGTTATSSFPVLRDQLRREFDGYSHRVELDPIGTRTLFTPGWMEWVSVEDRDGREVSVPLDLVLWSALRPSEMPLTDHLTYGFLTSREPPMTDPRAISGRIVDAAKARSVAEMKRLDSALKVDLDRYVRMEIPDAAAAAERGDPIAAAIAVDRHLNAPPFTYTLDLTVEDREIDPILDFLLNRQTGHCEYYASAATLLLRSQGVAARWVGGYKGGDWNASREEFEVRHLHAHAWVEVFDPGNGRWATLDPTPAARDTAVAANSEAVREGFSPVSWLRSMWYDGVFMTRGRQQQVIYRPLARVAAASWEVIRDYPQLVRAYWLGERLDDGRRPTLGRLLAPLAVLAAVILGGVLCIRWWRRNRRKGRSGPGRAQRRRPADAPDLPWFDRYISLVRGATGREREAAETPSEYVGRLPAAGDADDSFEQQRIARLADLGRWITPLFYSARFGRHAVAKTTAEEVEAALDEVAGRSP